MSIFSVGILAVVSMLVTSLRTTSFGRAITVANQLVQQQMEQAKSMTFNTTVQKMCDGGTAGFILPCTPASKYTVFGTRTTTERKAQYKASSTLSNVTYDVIMKSVKNHPVTNVDMVEGKVQWSDVTGSHNVTAVTYIER